MYTPRYPNIGQGAGCPGDIRLAPTEAERRRGSAKHGTIRMASFDLNIVNNVAIKNVENIV